MFINTHSLTDTSNLHADICIVGSGLAGLSLAREFLDRNERVVVLEAGGECVSAQSQKVYQGALSGVPAHSLTQSRFRAYGGSGTRWTGQCVPMQDIDFENRAEMPLCGWPLSRADIEPYYNRAASLLGISTPGFDLDAWQQQTGKLDPIAGDEIEASIIRFAKPMDLGASLKKELAQSQNVTVVLNAHVASITLNESLQQVSSVVIKRAANATFLCHAKQVVLACGGVENARLLLASNQQLAAGVGNENGLVGRYFMDHPYLTTGYWQPSARAQAEGLAVIDNFKRLAEGRGAHAAYTLSEEIRRREQLTACAAYFIKMDRYEVSPEYFSSGSQALVQLADMIKGERVKDAGDAIALLKAMTMQPLSTCRTLVNRLWSSYRPEPQLALRMVVEASPCRDSRVTLSANRDEFNEPRAHVHWCMADSDWKSVERFRNTLAQAIDQRGLGKLVDDRSHGAGGWSTSMMSGKHHMGTTRMHQEPNHGVVDANLRIHSLTNCFVAGSSVFPTGSWVNPSFTLIALSLRLADHLKSLSQSSTMKEVNS